MRQGFQGEIRVLLRSGRYYLQRSLDFTADDGGDEHRSVTYASYPGESAMLIGGVRLQGWQPYKGRIVKARIRDGLSPRQVFEKDRPMVLARAPHGGWFRIAPIEGNPSGFVYKRGDLSPLVGDYSQGWARLWPWDWYTGNAPIVAQHPERRELIVDRRRIGGPDFHADRAGYPATRYALMNILELLDTPGEAFISLKERVVYCWPTAGGADDQEILISAAHNVIRVAGTPSGPSATCTFATCI